MNRNFYLKLILLAASLPAFELTAMEPQLNANQLSTRQAQISHILDETVRFLEHYAQFRHHGANLQIFEAVRNRMINFNDNFLNGALNGASNEQYAAIAEIIIAGGRIRSDIAVQLAITLE